MTIQQTDHSGFIMAVFVKLVLGLLVFFFIIVVKLTQCLKSHISHPHLLPLWCCGLSHLGYYNDLYFTPHVYFVVILMRILIV